MSPVRTRGEPGLLERDGELELIAALVARVRSGEGALLVVEGQAGVGKTALLRTAGDLGDAEGLRVLRTRGSELDRAFAFGMVRQLLERDGRRGPRAAHRRGGARRERVRRRRAMTRALRRASSPRCKDCTGSSSTSRRGGR